MSQTIHFDELIDEWQQLMCLDTKPLEEYGIALVEEDRILKLTARYIDQLESLQDNLESQAVDLAERTLALGLLEDPDAERLAILSQRFLANVGGSLRSEIPKNIPRSQRRKARQFVIDWSHGKDQASWPEVNVVFPLHEALLFCAEHYAGADKAAGEALTQELITAWQVGNVSIPRLSHVSTVGSRSEFHWDSATVQVEDADLVEPASPELVSVSLVGSPILMYFQERVQESKIRIEEQLASEEEFEDPHVAVAAVIDQEVALEDIPRKIRDYLGRVAAYSGTDRKHVLSAISSSAYWEAFEAIVCKDQEIAEQRVRVVKSCNAVRDE